MRPEGTSINVIRTRGWNVTKFFNGRDARCPGVAPNLSCVERVQDLYAHAFHVVDIACDEGEVVDLRRCGDEGINRRAGLAGACAFGKNLAPAFGDRCVY